jgi:methylated-DNA-[protein]-cysteine S-methyltransferase
LLNNSIAYYKSPIGLLKIISTPRGITSLRFIDDDSSEDLSQKNSPILTKCLTQLDEYFRGERKTFTVPITYSGTSFQKRVWNELTEISFGQTNSYKDIATKLGDCNASRAVGLANSNNPIAIIIPCHRVIGSNQKLTGYAGGIWRKKWLLDHEQLNDSSRKNFI